MKLQLENVYIISEQLTRQNLEDFYWPNEQRTFKRQKLIDQNKREGWSCHFLNRGLRLDGKIFIDKEDYSLWPQHLNKINKNIQNASLEFADLYEEDFGQHELEVIHTPENAEFVRKKIYISARFREKADNMWAVQFFPQRKKRDQMKFYLGFKREISDSDRKILSEIKNDFLSVQGVEING